MKNFISTIAGLTLAAGSLTGCATTPQSTSTAQTEHVSPALAVESTPKPKTVGSSSKIAVSIDLTGSRKENLASTTIEQVEPLIDHIGKYGGEIAFLTICSDSNNPALRMRVEPPSLLAHTKSGFKKHLIITEKITSDN